MGCPLLHQITTKDRLPNQTFVITAGARIRFDGKQRTVIDGPFTESKELVGGFWIIQVRSKGEAIEWMKRSPFQEGEIEIRQVFETEEFGDDLLPETRER